MMASYISGVGRVIVLVGFATSTKFARNVEFDFIVKLRAGAVDVIQVVPLVVHTQFVKTQP